jgi:protein TonB
VTYLIFGAILALLLYVRPPMDIITADLPDLIPTEIVFLDQPGPGGGGGGGGNKSILPPKTEPLPAIKPKEETPPPIPTPEPEPTPEPTPPAAEIPAVPIEAPVAVVASGPPTDSASLGKGTGTGAGTGSGSGIGSGTGSGLGEGTGGGTGGGAYQVGSGVSSPQPLNRPKPLYTAEAMLRRIQGEVLLSCIVLATGDMGKCNIVKPLDNNNYGLDNEALKAASKWKFAPA